MASDVLMPRLSDSMEEGTVLKWLVEVGGEVKRGAPLAEIETDKANMTYESDADGVLVEVLAEEGQTLPVGEVIARLGAEGEEPSGQKKDAAEPEPEPEGGAPEAKEAPQEPEARPAAAAREEGERIKASPVARRVAGDLRVDLGGVEGSGPGGRVVKSDVEAAAEQGGGEPAAQPEQPAQEKAPAGEEDRAADAKGEADIKGAAPKGEAGPKGEPEVTELTRLQRTVSRRMAESKATAPDFALSLDADMTLCIELRTRLKEQTEHAPSFNDMVVKAAALALRDHPKVNGAYRDGHFELYPRVNVGVAVAAQDTLV
ncbi:MAG: 2-oxo acid dehydrogenase subunit E2, partial [Thermoleophilaceae bacterium]